MRSAHHRKVAACAEQMALTARQMIQTKLNSTEFSNLKIYMTELNARLGELVKEYDTWTR